MDSKKEKKDGFLGDWALGCLGQVAVLAVLAGLASTRWLGGVIAWAIIFALPALFARFLMHRSGWRGGWPDRLLGPAFLLLAVVFMAAIPLETEQTEPAAGGGAVVVADAPDGEAPTLEEALAELDGLVGLEPVKAEVRRIADAVRVAQARKAAGLATPAVSYHMVFTGNPGTGKTTVARILAKIFRALGVLEKGQLVETDRSGLVAGYQGQTSIKANETIDRAIGGVLFIDEAYALAGRNGEGDSYGDEAIAALLKRMEDDRDRLVVIVAGYTEEMKKFIDANSGLASRFTHYVEFPDYSATELAAMFRMNAKKSQYVLSADVEKWLDAYVRVNTAKRDRKFGNGRWARGLFEDAVSRQAVRLSAVSAPTPEQLKTLTMKDVGIKLKDPDASLED